jgi:hypothetical protein
VAAVEEKKKKKPEERKFLDRKGVILYPFPFKNFKHLSKARTVSVGRFPCGAFLWQVAAVKEEKKKKK